MEVEVSSSDWSPAAATYSHAFSPFTAIVCNRIDISTLILICTIFKLISLETMVESYYS